MALADVIRLVIPSDLRIKVGLWAINIASHNELALKVFLTILYGKLPGTIKLTKTHCYYEYKGHKIYAEKHGAGAFLEIFQAEVYEQLFEPQPDDIVIDIGAYVGMFSIKASEKVGVNGKVIAVEPCPETFDLLQSNTEGIKNIELVRTAIMDKKGQGKLFYSNAAAAHSLILQRTGKYVFVQMMTLDELVKEKKLDSVDYIKIDAEGAEMNVLRGATETLAKGTKLVIAAYHTTENGELEIKLVEDYLQKAGYKVNYKRGLRSYLYAEKAN